MNFLRFLKFLFIPLLSVFVFQIICRLVFYIFQLISGWSLEASQLMNSFRYGVFMDISICSFLGMILLLVYFVQILTKNRISISPANQITIFFLLVIAIFYSIDIVLYKEWRFRLDDSIILYIQGLKEATHFIDYSNTIKFIGCLLLLSGIIFYIAVKAKKYLQPSTFKKSYLIYSLILCGLLIIPLRGGIGLAPLSPSWAYHSDNLFANHLSLNPLWNFIYTLNQNKGSNNYSNYLQDSEAKITFDSLTNTSDSSSFQFLKQRKPNIILIFLESFTSNFLNRKHKELEITPHLNSWLKKGVYFDNAYASGDRTDKGLPAVLSSYPSQSKTSILKYSNKTDKLESIADQLHLRGYTNYFYYGGDLLFAGMNSYFLANGFNHLIDKESFDPLSYNAKWGVHDHLLFRKILTDLDTLSSPFFLNILTISSHPPYDIPTANAFIPKNNEDRFVLSAHYADSSLGVFLHSISNSSQWENLLVILVADHGAHYPDSIQYHQKEKFHVPILFTGGCITKDTVIHKICSQTDISATLFSALKIPYRFKFSRNILSNDYIPFAYYSFNNGMGWVDENCYFVLSHDSKSNIIDSGICNSSYRFAKSYFQVLMQDFISK